MVSPRQAEAEKKTDHHVWASLLANKIMQMLTHVAERFKLKVDGLALDALDG